MVKFENRVASALMSRFTKTSPLVIFIDLLSNAKQSEKVESKKLKTEMIKKQNKCTLIKQINHLLHSCGKVFDLQKDLQTKHQTFSLSHLLASHQSFTQLKKKDENHSTVYSNLSHNDIFFERRSNDNTFIKQFQLKLSKKSALKKNSFSYCKSEIDNKTSYNKNYSTAFLSGNILVISLALTDTKNSNYWSILEKVEQQHNILILGAIYQNKHLLDHNQVSRLIKILAKNRIHCDTIISLKKTTFLAQNLLLHSLARSSCCFFKNITLKLVFVLRFMNQMKTTG